LSTKKFKENERNQIGTHEVDYWGCGAISTSGAELLLIINWLYWIIYLTRKRLL